MNLNIKINKTLKELYNGYNRDNLTISERIKLINDYFLSISPHKKCFEGWNTVRYKTDIECYKYTKQNDFKKPYIKNEVYVRYGKLNEDCFIFNKTQKFKDFEKELRDTLQLTENWNIETFNEKNGIPAYIKLVIKQSYLENYYYERMIHIMCSFGYFISKDRASTYKHNIAGDVLVYQFEPYYYEGYQLTLNKRMFHITPSWNEKSILDGGLIAKSENNKFQYPSRIFFFIGDLVYDNVYSIFYDGYVFDLEKEGENEITVFRMDVEMLRDAQIEFYIDPKFLDERAVYTYEKEISDNFFLEWRRYEI